MSLGIKLNNPTYSSLGKLSVNRIEKITKGVACQDKETAIDMGPLDWCKDLYKMAFGEPTKREKLIKLYNELINEVNINLEYLNSSSDSESSSITPPGSFSAGSSQSGLAHRGSSKSNYYHDKRAIYECKKIKCFAMLCSMADKDSKKLFTIDVLESSTIHPDFKKRYEHQINKNNPSEKSPTIVDYCIGDHSVITTTADSAEARLMLGYFTTPKKDNEEKEIVTLTDLVVGGVRCKINTWKTKQFNENITELLKLGDDQLLPSQQFCPYIEKIIKNASTSSPEQKKLLAIASYNLATTYLTNKNYDQANKFYNLAIENTSESEFLEKITQKIKDKIETLKNVATNAQIINKMQYTLAVAYSKLATLEQHDRLKQYGYSKNAVSNYEQSSPQQNLDSQKQAQSNPVKISKSNKPNEVLNEQLELSAKIATELAEESFKKDEYRQAIIYYQEAIKYYGEIEQPKTNQYQSKIIILRQQMINVAKIFANLKKEKLPLIAFQCYTLAAGASLQNNSLNNVEGEMKNATHYLISGLSENPNPSEFTYSKYTDLLNCEGKKYLISDEIFRTCILELTTAYNFAPNQILENILLELEKRVGNLYTDLEPSSQKIFSNAYHKIRENRHKKLEEIRQHLKNEYAKTHNDALQVQQDSNQNCENYALKCDSKFMEQLEHDITEIRVDEFGHQTTRIEDQFSPGQSNEMVKHAEQIFQDVKNKLITQDYIENNTEKLLISVAGFQGVISHHAASMLPIRYTDNQGITYTAKVDTQSRKSRFSTTEDKKLQLETNYLIEIFDKNDTKIWDIGYLHVNDTLELNILSDNEIRINLQGYSTDVLCEIETDEAPLVINIAPSNATTIDAQLPWIVD